MRLYYEERLRDKLLNHLAKNGWTSSEDCAKLFSSNVEFGLIKNWLINKGLVKHDGYFKKFALSTYGKFYVENNQQFFVKSLKRDALWFAGAVITILTLYFSIKSYEEAKKTNLSTQQSQSQSAQDTIQPAGSKTHDSPFRY